MTYRVEVFRVRLWWVRLSIDEAKVFVFTFGYTLKRGNVHIVLVICGRSGLRLNELPERLLADSSKVWFEHADSFLLNSVYQCFLDQGAHSFWRLTCLVCNQSWRSFHFVVGFWVRDDGVLWTHLVNRSLGCLFVLLGWTALAIDYTDWSLRVWGEWVQVYDLVFVVSALIVYLNLKAASILQIQRPSLLYETISLCLKLFQEIESLYNLSIQQIGVLGWQHH